MKHYQQFKSSDLSLVALLRLYDYRVVGTERIGTKTFFVFQASARLESIVNQFWNNELKVSPLKYFDSLKSSKSYIYKITV